MECWKPGELRNFERVFNSTDSDRPTAGGGTATAIRDEHNNLFLLQKFPKNSPHELPQKSES